MKDTSIVDYASQTANKLALSFRAVGLAIGLLIAIGYSVYHHFSVANTVLNIAKTNLAQSIQIGGIYYQSRLANSMIKTNLFDHVWIYDSNKSLIVREDHEAEHEETVTDIWNKSFFTENLWPYALIKSDISYNGQHTGTLFVAYRLPLETSFILLFIISIIFLILSYYLKVRILRLGENIANPVFAFMKNLEENLKINKFGNKEKGRSFVELVKFEKWLTDFFKQAKQSDKIARKALADAQIAKVASQVRHDIQGAIMIANSALGRIEKHNNEVRILKASLERVKSTIQDIPKLANLTDDETHLLETNKSSADNEDSTSESCHLLSIITQVISDLSLSSNDIDFKYSLDRNADNYYVDVNYCRFERILFNLYKNAMESFDDEGIITTYICKAEGKVQLIIEDNGKGIPDNICDKLGERGVTYDKEEGTGLGVYDAFKQLEKWNSQIKYESEVNKGTKVLILFDECSENPLFPCEILLNEHCTVVVLDDDPSVHESWKQRFSIFKDKNINFKYFSDPLKAKCEIENLKSGNDDFLFLGDYDLRSDDINGIDFINKNNIKDCSLLVTSSVKCVLDTCRTQKIPVISKSVQSIISIHSIS